MGLQRVGYDRVTEQQAFIKHLLGTRWGFPGGTVVKNLTANAGDARDVGREDPLEKGMAIHSSILAWEILHRGAWRATVHRVPKS